MKNAFFLLLILLLCLGAAPRPAPSVSPTIQDEMQNPVNVLMKDLTKYRVAILWKGPGWGAGSQYILEDRAKESKELRELVKSGVLAGIVRVPGEEKCKLIAFFKTDSKDEAWATLNGTKVVKEKILTPELYTIWGSKGMGEALRAEMAKGNKPEKRQSLYVTLFTKGPNWKADAPADTMTAWASRHAAAVLKWKESGSLKFYGAVDDAGPLRVMGIFSAHNIEEAKKKLASAPSVKEGWFKTETYGCSVLEGMLP